MAGKLGFWSNSTSWRQYFCRFAGTWPPHFVLPQRLEGTEGAADGPAAEFAVGTIRAPGHLRFTTARSPSTSSSPAAISPFFPGGYIPALSEVPPSIERAGLLITDIEILRLHYAETLRAWRERLNSPNARTWCRSAATTSPARRRACACSNADSGHHCGSQENKSRAANLLQRRRQAPRTVPSGFTE